MLEAMASSFEISQQNQNQNKCQVVLMTTFNAEKIKDARFKMDFNHNHQIIHCVKNEGKYNCLKETFYCINKVQWTIHIWIKSLSFNCSKEKEKR